MRADIGRAGRGLQEADVADDRRIVDEGTKEEGLATKPEGHDGRPERPQDGEIREVRATDIEPYTGLRYLSKLFRFMAVILVVLLVAEVATGVYTQGSSAIPTLLGEASRLIVLAGVLWGTGDLAHLLIDVGHDVRAARILVARVAHAAKVAPLVPLSGVAPGTRTESAAPTRRNDAGFSDRAIPSPSRIADRDDDGGEGPPIP
jgi:hypothetical protein